MKLVMSLWIIWLLCACQAAPPPKVDYQPLLHDQAFSGFDQVPVESKDQLLSLNAQVTDFLARQIRPIANSVTRMQTLNKLLFNPHQLNLIYQASANTTPNQTFARGRANCLSMSMLAYVMAKQVGLQATLQEVQIPEFWDLRRQYSVLDGHVNLKMSAPKVNKFGQLTGLQSLVADFNDVLAGDRFDAIEISPDQVVAMFYNNKGAEALLNDKHIEAYAYFRQALITAPDYLPTWSNLGVLYRISGHLDWAEHVYNRALSAAPDNRALLDNLAALLERTGRAAQAAEIRARVDKQRQKNPYYHFYLAQQHARQQHWQAAITEYHKALRLNHHVDSFYFGLALAYMQQGKMDLTRRNLLLARRHADSDELQQRYDTKLAAFNRLVQNADAIE